MIVGDLVEFSKLWFFVELILHTKFLGYKISFIFLIFKKNCLGEVFGYYLLVLGGEGGIFSFGLVNPIDYFNNFSILKWGK